MYITERQGEILSYLVEKYIHTAMPVSSGLLEEICDLNVSAATIRNDLQELAKKRYITQLHTSGGRVPTDKAYRFYVDEIMEGENIYPTLATKRKIKEVISTANDAREINRAAANMLARLSENLVITNIVERDDFYKTGLASLFEFPEFKEFDKIFNLTSFFDNFESIFNKMERDFFSELSSDFRVVIGKENPLKNIQDETVILARYNLPDNFTGSLTLIGPTRMNYEKNIGLVRCVVDEINARIKEI